MITDTLSNAILYYGCHERFEAGFEFIKRAVLENLDVGKYEIDGNKIYASIQKYETKDDTEKFEGHQKYIDIQFIVSGEEYMECSHIDECEIISEYNQEKDVAFYVSNGLKAKLELHDNQFAVFFPEDIHKPGVKLDANSPVKKIVVKVMVD